MKKYISIALMGLSLAGMTSCDMDAPSQSTLDANTVFSQADLAEGSVMAIHDCWGKTNSYRGRWIAYYGMNTDAEWYNGASYSERTNAKYATANYSTTEDNTQLNVTNDTYTALYEGIEKATIAIDNFRQYGDLTKANIQQLLGEALTLRAFIYVELMRTFGDVPGRFVQTTNENSYMPRTSQDSIYRRVLADLKEAEDYCAWPNETDVTKSTERVSKSFVKGLRARAALYACGYKLYSDGTGYHKPTDTELNDNAMWQIAKEECLDVINSGHNVLGSFEENFRKICEESYAAGEESIFEIPFAAGRGRVVSSKGIRMQSPYNQFLTYQKTGSVGGESGPIPSLYYDYDTEDVRRDITCVPYRWYNGGDGNDGDAVQEPWGIKNWCFGKLRYEWMKRLATSLDDGINWQVMRYADIYLMAAEAINELDGPSAAAPYLRPILERALPANKVAVLMNQYQASKDAFRQGIRDQRKFEFAGEMLRKQDLIRWGIIDQVLADTKTKLKQFANRQGDYAGLPAKLYYVTDKDGYAKTYGLTRGDIDSDGGSQMSSTEAKDYIADKLGAASWDDVQSKGWFVSNDANNLTDDIIDGLYVVDKPSLHCVWPLPQLVINNSAGTLNNDFLK